MTGDYRPRARGTSPALRPRRSRARPDPRRARSRRGRSWRRARRARAARGRRHESHAARGTRHRQARRAFRRGPLRDRARREPRERGRAACPRRGQESAGLAATDGRDLRVVRRMGLVGQVFSEPDLSVLEGRAAMGHTRYSTTGASKIQNAQPMVVRDERLGELAIAHNGNCINARELRDTLAAQGVRFVTSSDTEVVAQAMANAPGASWDERIAHALPQLAGAWSLVMLTPSALYA